MQALVRDTRKERLREAASDLGFVGFGVTSAAELACSGLLEAWVHEGRHGRMDYLERELPRRSRPVDWLVGAKSVIVCAYPYAGTTVRQVDWKKRLTGRIAAYAFGADYHEAVHARLVELAVLLQDARFRVHIDSGPLVEKEFGRRAGLGWYGHNTNLLAVAIGSTFLLGCIVTDAELNPDPPFEGDHCGSCRACVPACPTGALSAGPSIDARRCVSYLTIEHRGPIPHSLRPLLGEWVFGCDDCQTVCPWNEANDPQPGFLYPSLVDLLEQDDDDFRRTYGGSAVARAKRAGLARNAAVALGNSGNAAALPALLRSLREDPSALVRAHVAWAIGRIGGPEALRVLRTGCAEDLPRPVAAEIRAATLYAGRRDGDSYVPTEGLL